MTDEKPAYRHAQDKAMELVDDWTRKFKTPMPKKEMFKGLVNADISESTARKSMEALVKKGKLRRHKVGNTTEYVMVGSIRHKSSVVNSGIYC